MEGGANYLLAPIVSNVVGRDGSDMLVVWVGLGLQSFLGLWRGPFSTTSLVDCSVQLVGCLGGLVAFLVSRVKENPSPPIQQNNRRKKNST
jgi:membrane associated rhomboid family serine protease